MNEDPHNSLSRLLKYLPAIYQEPEPEKPAPESAVSLWDWPTQPELRVKRPFLNSYLLPFEQILLGRHERSNLQGLEQTIASLHRFFEPMETDKSFLPWLAGWAALSLRFDIDVQRNRELLAQIIPLYRIRGTARYLERMLHLLLNTPAVVTDEFPPFQIRAHSTLGQDTYLGGGGPHFFKVTMVFAAASREADSQLRLAREVIELAKPAHTVYELDMVVPKMQIGVHSTVGLDSVL